jgi:hypothetical protein
MVKVSPSQIQEELSELSLSTNYRIQNIDYLYDHFGALKSVDVYVHDLTPINEIKFDLIITNDGIWPQET